MGFLEARDQTALEAVGESVSKSLGLRAAYATSQLERCQAVFRPGALIPETKCGRPAHRPDNLSGWLPAAPSPGRGRWAQSLDAYDGCPPASFVQPPTLPFMPRKCRRGSCEHAVATPRRSFDFWLGARLGARKTAMHLTGCLPRLRHPRSSNASTLSSPFFVCFPDRCLICGPLSVIILIILRKPCAFGDHIAAPQP